MEQKSYTTPLGVIKYWVNIVDRNIPTLVFLPGLTADHRLFDKQIDKCRLHMYNRNRSENVRDDVFLQRHLLADLSLPRYKDY